MYLKQNLIGKYSFHTQNQNIYWPARTYDYFQLMGRVYKLIDIWKPVQVNKISTFIANLLNILELFLDTVS